MSCFALEVSGALEAAATRAFSNIFSGEDSPPGFATAPTTVGGIGAPASGIPIEGLQLGAAGLGVEATGEAYKAGHFLHMGVTHSAK